MFRSANEALIINMPYTPTNGEEMEPETMTASAHWQLDRLSPEARDAAEMAAQHARVPLSQWLGHLIAETCTAEGVVLAAESPPRMVAPVNFAQAAFAPPPTLPMAPRVVPMAPPQPIMPAPQTVPFRPAAAQPFVPQPTPPVMTPPTPFRPVPAPVMPPMAAEIGQMPLPFNAATLILPPGALEPGTTGTRNDEADAPEALVAAIAREGLRQPILARRKPGEDGRYEIVAGRRRWRAAKRLGMTQIAVVVTNMPDPEAVLSSLSENLGEGNLSPIEEARAYLRLLTEFSLDPRDVSGAVGRDMPHIVRTLRLMGLPPRARDLIATGRLTRAHAYALLDQPDPERAADQMLAEQSGVDEALRRIAAVPMGTRP